MRFGSGLALGVVALCAVACRTSETDEPEVAGRRIQSVGELTPLKAISGRQKVRLAGTDVAAEVRSNVTDNRLEIELVRNDAVLDREIYVIQDNGLLLESAVGEAFDPPLLLFQFPGEIGGRHRWEGYLNVIGPNGTITDQAIEARADVVSAMDKLAVNGSTEHAVRITANITLGGGQPNARSRQIRVWILPGKGILKREFGPDNVREPVTSEVQDG